MSTHVALDRLLDRASDLLGRPLEDTQRRGELTDSASTHPPVPGSGPVKLGDVEAVARHAGLVSDHFSAPPIVVVDRVVASRPLISVDAAGVPFLITAAARGRARVESMDGSRAWLTPSELADRLGLNASNIEAEWLAVGPEPKPLPPPTHHSAWRDVWDLLDPERADLIAIAIYAAVVGLLSLTLPLAVQALVGTVAFGTILQPIVLLSILLLGGLSFAATLQALMTWTVELIQRRLFVRLVSDLAHRLPRVHVSAFESGHGPELLNRFFDVFLAQKAVASLLLGGIEAVLTATAGLLLLAFYHPTLLAFGLCILLGMIAIMWGLGRGAARTSVLESKAKYAVAGWMEEMARHIFALKTEGGAAFARNQLDRLAATWLRRRSEHFRIAFRQRIGTLTLQVLASASLLALGGWLVIERELTVGQLVAAELVVTAVVGAISKIGSKLESIYDLVASADKLAELRALPLEREEGDPPLKMRGPARLTFHHTGMEDEALHEVAPGSSLAIRSDDAGRSRVADALFGLRGWDKGTIRLDGDDVRDLALSGLRARVAVVRLSETLPGTIAENLGAGRQRLRSSDIWSVLARVGLDERVRQLSDGLRTKLTPSGLPLSPRETLRLTIARAILASPSLLVVDGALDTFPRHEQSELLGALRRGTTVICVTRETALAEECDARLEEGELA